VCERDGCCDDEDEEQEDGCEDGPLMFPERGIM
jgi:hypothetical protein